MIRKTAIAALASIAMFAASCGNSNSHNQHEGHNHATETTHTDTNSNSHNEKGELIDAAGNIITGCPMHKEMVGSKGDKCPKCNYMEMTPITWSLEGIDTVRVTTLSDYNPPMNKQ